ncbi:MULTISPECIES: hypothetical protein [Dyella]|uniref:hypothetical protein n=1 Tax=Dyella TaxID=231454 RepID=UPI0013F16690|nr:MULTISPECIES: hypothetical protein [Dyella]
MTQQNKPGHGIPEDQKQHAREATGKEGKHQDQQSPKREASHQPQNPQRQDQGNKHQH